MARTLNQRMADSHEADIAEWIQGTLQKGSGNQWHAQGDAKNGEHLVPHPITADGKATLGESIGISRSMWKKITDQTFNQNPALFLRFYEDERLRNVALDLAVVRAGFLVELIEDAREWRTFVEKIESAPLTLASPLVIEWTGPYFCPTAEEVEQKPGSGFDQCCGREDLHIPLPEGEGTEILSRILSNRQKARVAPSPEAHVYLSTSCLHGECGYCQGDTGAAGTKIPAQCKFCASPCTCSCHGPQHHGCDCCR